jgi:hypothetical protein
LTYDAVAVCVLVVCANRCHGLQHDLTVCASAFNFCSVHAWSSRNLVLVHAVSSADNNAFCAICFGRFVNRFKTTSMAEFTGFV